MGTDRRGCGAWVWGAGGWALVLGGLTIGQVLGAAAGARGQDLAPVSDAERIADLWSLEASWDYVDPEYGPRLALWLESGRGYRSPLEEEQRRVELRWALDRVPQRQRESPSREDRWLGVAIIHAGYSDRVYAGRVTPAVLTVGEHVLIVEAQVTNAMPVEREIRFRYLGGVGAGQMLQVPVPEERARRRMLAVPFAEGTSVVWEPWWSRERGRHWVGVGRSYREPWCAVFHSEPDPWFAIWCIAVIGVGLLSAYRWGPRAQFYAKRSRGSGGFREPGAPWTVHALPAHHAEHPAFVVRRFLCWWWIRTSSPIETRDLDGKKRPRTRFVPRHGLALVAPDAEYVFLDVPLREFLRVAQAASMPPTRLSEPAPIRAGLTRLLGGVLSGLGALLVPYCGAWVVALLSARLPFMIVSLGLVLAGGWLVRCEYLRLDWRRARLAVLRYL